MSAVYNVSNFVKEEKKRCQRCQTNRRSMNNSAVYELPNAGGIPYPETEKSV